MENEKSLKEHPDPVSLKQTEEIANLMKSSVCKINAEDGAVGTGFFCKIPDLISEEISNKKNFLKVLITNYHVINEKQKNLTISVNNEKKIIKDIENKVIYKDEKFDIIIIDIKDKTEIDDFLELDPDIFNRTDESYTNNSIYILHYPKGKDVFVLYGTIKSIDDFSINHLCCIDTGSLGSPIINLSNNKVIGMHSQSSKNNYNIGILLKDSINDLLKEDYILDLSNKNLGDNGIKILLNYKNIKELNLSYNKLTNIEVLEDVKFEKLEKLNLSNNDISYRIYILKDVNFKELKELNLSSNHIGHIEDLEKVKFEKLKILNLEDNYIFNIRKP